MAKDKEKKLKSKNKKLKQKLESALRHIATLEGKDPEQFVSNFEQEESDSTTDKLLDALGLKAKKKKGIQDQLRSLGYELKRIEKDDDSDEDYGFKVPADTIVIGPHPSSDEAKKNSEYKGKIVYKGKTEEERKQKMKEHVSDVVDHYCDSEGIIADYPRTNLIDFIMNNGSEGAKVFKYLRQYKGEIPPETVKKHTFEKPDGTPLRAADSEWLLIEQSRKIDEFNEIRDKIEELTK